MQLTGTYSNCDCFIGLLVGYCWLVLKQTKMSNIIKHIKDECLSNLLKFVEHYANVRSFVNSNFVSSICVAKNIDTVKYSAGTYFKKY